LTITPINDLNSFNSTYLDFTACEEILRKEHKIPSNELLTILLIEINKMNEKALTNQVEYAIFNERRQQLNLTFCKNAKIKINYEIKDQSVLNKTMIQYYSD
jgi:predicted nucleotide-binding protein (sugar kinase/HSP70/actin superfamily)